MKTSRVVFPALFATGLLCSNPALAQNEPDGQWHFLLQPYLMLPNMNGETAIGVLPAVEVKEDPSDILENLQWGAMLYAEARNDDWVLSSDVLYMDLKSDLDPGDGVVTIDGHVDLSQIGWELAFMRRLSRWFDFGIAATYNQLDVDLDFILTTPLGSTPQTGGLEQDWIDPSFVARATVPISDKWFFQARGNLGGFGVGSEMFWQFMADFAYRPSEKWFFSVGYRIIDVDFEDGSGTDRFVYDMQTFGPVLRVGFNL